MTAAMRSNPMSVKF